MKMKFKNAILLALSFLLAVTMLLTGCGKKKVDEQASPITYNGSDIYPIQCDDELTYFRGLNGVVATKYSNFGETPVAKYIEEQTGVKISYTHPASGMEDEQFNMILTSHDLPDLIAEDWLGYGPEQAIDEGYIFDFTDYMEEWAPNLTKYLKEHPELDKEIRTDDGRYYVFPFLRGDPYLCTYIGPIIRKDWLDKCNLDVPETIDEWDTMLQAFKDKMGATAPLAFDPVFLQFGAFSGAYGTPMDYYLDDEGKVKYGPAEQGFKDLLAKLHDWYERGLYDNNFMVSDGKIIDGYMLNGDSGATMGFAGGSIGTWLAGKKDADFDLVGPKYPVLNKGDHPAFGARDWEYNPGASVAISATCKNKELAMRFLDWGFSEEGRMAYNFGIEGVSYEMVDGKAQFTDLVTNNPDGEPLETMLSVWSHTSYNAPSVQDRIVVDTQRPYAQQREAVENWKDNDMTKHMLPLISLTADESSSISGKKTDIDTYMKEMVYGFIMGTESLDNYDQFVNQLYSLGLQDVLDTTQTAVDRYNKR